MNIFNWKPTSLTIESMTDTHKMTKKVAFNFFLKTVKINNKPASQLKLFFIPLQNVGL